MSQPLYSVPENIKNLIEQAKYSRWLRAKAMAHVRRDRKRHGKDSCSVSLYKAAIHRAVCSGGERDFYTGEILDWKLAGKWENAASKEGRVKYKKEFALLPTLDHTHDNEGNPKFVICSWRVNDAKNDLTHKEFIDLCEKVLAYQKPEKNGGGGGS